MRYLIIDSTLNYKRNLCANSAVDSSGNPFGGCVGFLKSLYYFDKACKPDKIILVFDGENGSKKRREIYKDYKAGRKPLKFGKHIHINSSDIEQNIKYQFQRLISYLQDLPVYIVRIDDVEADDVIAYLNNHFSLDQKVIVTEDKDFYQLLNEKTIIYRPAKRTFYTNKECVSEYKILPHNFSVAKSFIGDKSDNIKGVKGVGYKTILKYFPLLMDEKKIELKQLFEYCENNLEKNERYKVFLANRDLIMNNHKILQLENSIMSAQSIDHIKKILDMKLYLNITNFRLNLMKDGIEISESFLTTFRRFAAIPQSSI